MKNAIVICSGGLDSVTTAFYVKRKLGYEKILVLFFDYGQRNVDNERKAAKKCALNLDAEFREIELKELKKISVHLTDKKSKVNKIARKDLKDSRKESEKWHFPSRNTFFIVYALALAEKFYLESKNIYEIFLGFKNEGKEAFPDTTPEYVKEMNKLQKISTAGKFRIKAPLIKKDKEEIIKLGERLGVIFEETYSCYVGSKNGKHCGECLACKLRQEGFYWSGVEDPTSYKS